MTCNTTSMKLILVVICFVSSCLAFGHVSVDTNGTALSTSTASSAVGCASLCDLNTNCAAWSWDSCSAIPSNCYLRSTASGFAANACRISGAKLGEVGVDRAGTNITGYYPLVLPASSTAADCAAACETVTSCVTWSFDNSGRQNCYLMSTIPANTTKNAMRTSGVQGILNLNSPYLGIYTWLLGANYTATQCSELCFATAGCKFWLFSVPTNKTSCINNAGLCWAKKEEFMTPSQDACYVAGKQPISTVVATPSNRTTAATLLTGVKAGTFPFNEVVAFGDNLSDNGNGSVAHCVAAAPPTNPGKCNNTIYGASTWTDGPIAVSFLVTYLNMSLTLDFAFGHANGGSKFGATIDNSFTNSFAPSAKDQIANYTNGPAAYRTNIAKTLHFLWIGANDIQLISAGYPNHISVSSTNNSVFAQNFSSLMVQRVQSLIDIGAVYIFVPSLYPKHVAPIFVDHTYFTLNSTQLANLGLAIAQANAAVKAALAQFGPNVIFYDAYTFLLSVYNNPSPYGITHTNGSYIDGYSQLDWELGVTDGLGYTFFWMQFLDMTSNVHNLLAADMYKTLVNIFG